VPELGPHFKLASYAYNELCLQKIITASGSVGVETELIGALEARPVGLCLYRCAAAIVWAPL